MNKEQTCSIIYDLALASSGETEPQPLLQKTLQRLLYHTAFPCGIFVSDIRRGEGDDASGLLEMVIGNHVMTGHTGSRIDVPTALLTTQPAALDDTSALNRLTGEPDKYHHVLCAPVGQHATILMFSPNPLPTGVPYAQLLQPILANFDKNLQLCRQNAEQKQRLRDELQLRRELESRARDSQRMLRAVLNSIPNRVFWKDTQSTYLGCNQAFAQDAGLDDPEQIIGKTDYELPWGKRPEAETFRADDAAVIASGTAKLNSEERQTRPKGYIAWLLTSRIPLTDDDDHIIGVLGTYQDITERKLIEENLKRHRMAMENASEGMAILDQDGVYRYLNPAHACIYGYASPAELLGKHWKTLYQRDEIERFDRHILPALASSGRWEGEATGIRQDGTAFPQSLSLVALENEGLVCVVRDITAQKAAERQLRDAKDEAIRANRAKSDFLSSMSHELRTPMNAILGFSQLLEMDPRLTEQQLNNISEIGKAGRHLLELINEVLDLARIESGKISLSIQPLSLKTVIDECGAIAGALAIQHSIGLQVYQPSCDMLVKGDHTRLKQVLLNLISNAIKYNRPQGQVTVDCIARSSNRVRLEVKDTGYGISEQQQQMLFKPFERLGAEESSVEGTGIGLVITKQLVDLMGGTIGVESDGHTGSTFWVELEAIPGPGGTSPASEANERPNPAERSSNKRVLYIEDNPTNLRLVQQILSTQPTIDLSSAPNGELGLAMALQQRPDLILLDIHLGEMDGYDLLRIFKQRSETRHIPVVAISANAMQKDIEKGRQAGFNDYLTKPLDIPAFLDMLERFLEN